MPIFGLFDSDVYGLMILKNYAFGSIRAGINFHPIPIPYVGVKLLDYDKGWLNIKKRDFKIMTCFLQTVENLVHEHDSTATETLEALKTETQRGMFLWKKCEMNVISRNDETQRDFYSYAEKAISRVEEKYQ